MKKIYFLFSTVLILGLGACQQGGGDHGAGDKAAANIEATRKVFGFLESAQLDSLDAYVKADYIEHNPDLSLGLKSTGLALMKETFAMYHTAIPDQKFEITDIAGVGDMVWVHGRLKGTNSGSMGPGMPATGKTVDVDFFDKLKIVDGMMVEHWGFIDGMAMMMQLGMMGGAPADSTATPAAAQAGEDHTGHNHPH